MVSPHAVAGFAAAKMSLSRSKRRLYIVSVRKEIT